MLNADISVFFGPDWMLVRFKVACGASCFFAGAVSYFGTVLCLAVVFFVGIIKKNELATE